MFFYQHFLGIKAFDSFYVLFFLPLQLHFISSLLTIFFSFIFLEIIPDFLYNANYLVIVAYFLFQILAQTIMVYIVISSSTLILSECQLLSFFMRFLNISWYALKRLDLTQIVNQTWFECQTIYYCQPNSNILNRKQKIVSNNSKIGNESFN